MDLLRPPYQPILRKVFIRLDLLLDLGRKLFISNGLSLKSCIYKV
jgi:hypothetical protein